MTHIERSSHEGHVYILRISSGRVKVGFTTNLKTRLANHATTAKAYGASIVQTWTSPLHVEAGLNERRLIAFCRACDGMQAEGEYFAGVAYEDVVAYAESELVFTEVTPGQSASEAQKAAARLARSRALDRAEASTEFVRRRAQTQIESAGVPTGRLTSASLLANPSAVRLLAQMHDGEAVSADDIRAAFEEGAR